VLLAVGAIVLAITGAEALYADMGHFGRGPSSWPGRAMCCPRWPELPGAGRAADARPAALENPFLPPVPRSLLIWPALVLATLAAIIASQAVISGAFSITGRPCNWACCRA
jgi:KUP system potassium uptake protein